MLVLVVLDVGLAFPVLELLGACVLRYALNLLLVELQEDLHFLLQSLLLRDRLHLDLGALPLDVGLRRGHVIGGLHAIGTHFGRKQHQRTLRTLRLLREGLVGR